ncbi:hypothetical protein [Paenibacillus cookii]|uniref:Uncharacterized protein n=1 Tax=Paenibacillus cookii TaxID=157839 RepID=A0ABQ4LSK8_9BACL|nr:hypothetical protein [Paenibacillus cookii]GIO66242.1 hypothetical protein J21TS3_10630 [Paenibacillus cookii]
MTWWMWLLNIAGLLALMAVFYRLEKKWTSKAVLLAPVIIYVLVSLEDLFGLIDLMRIVPGRGGHAGANPAVLPCLRHFLHIVHF